MRRMLVPVLCLALFGEVVADGPRGSAVGPRGTVTARGEYVPPTGPRTQAVFGALYRELSDSDGAAGKLADRLHPQTPLPESPEARLAWLESEDARLAKWFDVHGKELLRRLAQIAARERLPIQELEDIRDEGDCRLWFADPAKAARSGKTEERIQEELKSRREDRRSSWAAENATKARSRQKGVRGKK